MPTRNIIDCITRRAHLAGADAAILEKQADAIAATAGPVPDSILDASPAHLEAISLAIAAHEARRRYFRELTALDILQGNTPSPFDHLG